jgi:hypothetical protein
MVGVPTVHIEKIENGGEGAILTRKKLRDAAAVTRSRRHVPVEPGHDAG